MAKSSSSVYGFYLRKSLMGVDNPASLPFLITLSSTLTIGDAVRLTTAGTVSVVTTGESILGIVVGLVDKNGVNVFSPRASGTAGTTLTADDTVTVSATNVSDATRNLKALVVLDPGGYLLWYNDADDDMAQTNVGQCFDVNSTGDIIDVASATDATAQFQLLELDPDGDSDASKGLFRINENQY